MKVFTRSGVATLLITTAVLAGLSVPGASAQLPPTSWGKSVHKPGDNQYDPHGAQQMMRHMMPTAPSNPRLVISAPAQGGGPDGPAPWTPKPKPRTPDVSLEPIPADEPVAPPGFPPMPERLELPGVRKVTAMNFSVRPSARRRHRGGGGGSGPSPFQGTKQGYSHFTPGSFSAQKKNGGGGGGEGRRFYDDDDDDGGSAPRSALGGSGGGGGVPTRSQQGYTSVPPGSFGVKSHGYYKCQSPGAMGKPIKQGTNEDTFGSNSGDAGAKPPAYTGASMAALKKLGREPKLDDKRAIGGEAGAPDAPTPVQINQAATQDLSLPDDDFEYRRPKSRTGSYMKRRLGNYLYRAPFMMMNRLGAW